MTKMSFWPQKNPFLDPKNNEKGQTLTFSVKLYFLHFLVKFKQKIAQKSKNMAKKWVFGPKKGHFCTPKNGQKGSK